MPAIVNGALNAKLISQRKWLGLTSEYGKPFKGNHPAACFNQFEWIGAS
jgi:hypothetical protein